MALSSEELRRIHLNKLASPGKKYYGNDDNIYIGTKDKRLKLLDKADLVIVTKNVTTDNTIQGVLNNNASTIQDIELELQSSSLYKFKKFTYDTDGNITRKQIFSDSNQTTMLFDVIFTYVNNDLSIIDITRISDGFNFKKNLSYDGNGNLTNINII